MELGPSGRRLRYVDKDATVYGDMPPEVREHVQNATGIADERGWIAAEKMMCPFCDGDDHWISRCLKLFGSTERGKRVMTAQRAAEKVQQLLESKAPPSLQTALQAYTCGDCEEEPTHDELIYLVLENSDLLAPVEDLANAEGPRLLAAFNGAAAQVARELGHQFNVGKEEQGAPASK